VEQSRSLEGVVCISQQKHHLDLSLEHIDVVFVVLMITRLCCNHVLQIEHVVCLLLSSHASQDVAKSKLQRCNGLDD
jgi:hypothetical protein